MIWSGLGRRWDNYRVEGRRVEGGERVTIIAFGWIFVYFFCVIYIHVYI